MTDCNKEIVGLLSSEHLDGVAKIEAESFSSPWSKNALLHLLTGDNFGVAVTVGEKVVAYGGVSAVIPEGDITNVATLPEYRRQGYGERVVSAIIRESEKRGIRSLYLEVRRSNAAAIALYEKLGFVAIGERKNFYSAPKEDAVLMKREI